MKKLLYLFLLPSILFSQTTPSVTPRADGEGSIGTETYRWGEGHFGELYVEAPSLADDSNRVPTTSWVNNLVQSGGDLVSYTEKNSSFTAEPNKKYVVNTTSSDVTVTLPVLSRELIASTIVIRHYEGTNNIIINRAGSNIIVDGKSNLTSFTFKGSGSEVELVSFTTYAWIITRSNRTIEPSLDSDTNVAATTAWVNDLVLPIVSDVDTKLSGYLKKNSYPTGYQTHEGELILDSDWGEKILTLDMPDYGNLNAMWALDYNGIIDVMAQDYDPYNSKLLMSFKDLFTSSPYTEFVQPVKAPTPTAADDSTNVATTAWVQDEIATKLGDAVDSVAGKTGVVTLDADDISETATKLWFTATERAKLTGLGDAVDAVDSVAGKTGVVTLDADDVSETATKLWFTATERAKLTGLGDAVEPSGTDDTTAIQNAIDAGGIVQLGAGTYIVTTVDISNDVIIQGVGNDTIIKRKDGTITTQHIEPDAKLFNIDTDGINVIIRDLMIDENEANQNAYAAYGYAIGVDFTIDTITQGIDLVVENCTIKNITNCGIGLATGDTETVRSYLSVINCTFLDGRVGLAAGNENVVSPSGFSGYYILCSSFTQSHIVGNRFRFTTTLNDAEFPPVAIFVSSASNGATGCEMLIEGNYFYGCGRGDWYNSTPTIQLAGNVLGVIDIYNFGKRVRIVNNQFENNYAPAIRGKTNIDQLFVSGNIINDTFPNYGIIFGPSSLTEQVGNITITDNQLHNTGVTGIAISGNPTGHSTTKIINVVISGNLINGVSVVGTATGIGCAYIDSVKITDNNLINIGLKGIDVVKSCNDVIVARNFITCGDNGISFTASVTGSATISENTITSGGSGAALYGDGTNKISIIGNTIKSSNDYAFVVSLFDDVVVSDNMCGSVTGKAYFLRAQSCDNSIIVSGNTIPQSGVAPYYPHTVTAIAHIFGNSWNPRISYGTAAPASGTYKVGDVVYNTAPAPSGYTGWICTTSGTPGTWKGFGVIQS